MFLVLLFFLFLCCKSGYHVWYCPKRVYLPLMLNVNFFQLFPFSQRVTVRQIFYTRSNPLVDLHFHQVSNCGSLYVRQMCKLVRYEAPSFTYSLYVTKKKSSSSDSVCQSELPTKYIKTSVWCWQKMLPAGPYGGNHLYLQSITLALFSGEDSQKHNAMACSPSNKHRFIRQTLLLCILRNVIMVLSRCRTKNRKEKIL